MLTKYSHSLHPYPWHIGKAASRSWMYFTQCLSNYLHVHDSLLMCAYPRKDQMSLVPSFTSSCFSNNELIWDQIFLIQKPLHISQIAAAIVKACFPVEPWRFFFVGRKQGVDGYQSTAPQKNRCLQRFNELGLFQILRRLAWIYLRVPPHPLKHSKICSFLSPRVFWISVARPLHLCPTRWIL